MTVDLAAIEYLEALEQKLTNLLPLTNCTPGGAALRQILMHDLRPTIAGCYAELDEMAEQLREKENDYYYEEATDAPGH